jgi:hypothetical protein
MATPFWNYSKRGAANYQKEKVKVPRLSSQLTNLAYKMRLDIYLFHSFTLSIPTLQISSQLSNNNLGFALHSKTHSTPWVHQELSPRMGQGLVLPNSFE